MPGIIVALGKEQVNQTIVSKMTENAYANTIVKCFNSDYLSLNVLGGGKNEPFCVYEGQNWLIAYYGYTYCRDTLFHSFEDTNIEDLLESGVNEALKIFSGQYQLFLYSKRDRIGYAVNDKCGTHPWYLLSTKTHLLGAPEPLCYRSVKGFEGWEGDIDINAIPEFMASGHLWGERTFYKSLKRLGPGKISKSSETGWLDAHFFKMSYNNRFNSKQDAIENLKDAIVKDFKRIPAGRGVLTLSGGLDSRALLGLASQFAPEIKAVSYTFGTDILPNSDADIARTAAKIAGISWEGVVTSKDQFVENITSVIRATGGESDTACSQDAFLGPKFYQNDLKEFDFLLRGDEVWGWKDTAKSVTDAFWLCYLFNLDDFRQPQIILREEVFKEYIDQLKTKQIEFAKSCEYVEKERFDDFKDSLYWFHRESRLLQNMAYYRRGFIPHIAPFLFDNVLDCIQSIPSKFRVRKELFILTAKSLFPELFSINDMVTARHVGFSLEHAVRSDSQLRNLIEDALIDHLAPELASCFHESRFRNWVKTILTNSQGSAGDGRKSYYNLRQMYTFLRKSPYVRGLALSTLRKMGKLKFPVVNVNYLFRLTILSLTLREYGRD